MFASGVRIISVTATLVCRFRWGSSDAVDLGLWLIGFDTAGLQGARRMADSEVRAWANKMSAKTRKIKQRFY